MKKIPLLIAGLLLVSISMMAQDKKPTAIPADVEKLLTQYACLACHKADAKVIGPAYAEVAKKKIYRCPDCGAHLYAEAC